MTFMQLYGSGRHRIIYVLIKNGKTYTGSLESEDSVSIVLYLINSHKLKRIYAKNIEDQAGA